MVPGWTRLNTSYSLVVQELTNATLAPGGIPALRALHVEYILVTGTSSTLFPPFSASPLIEHGLPLLFSEGGAYLFEFPSAPGGGPGPS
jgi:hypothetical protein